MEETTLKQMLANLVIAKKAAAAEAKARKEKAKTQGQEKKPGPDGGRPEAKGTDAEWKEQRGAWEQGGSGGARGTGGQDEPGGRR